MTEKEKPTSSGAIARVLEHLNSGESRELLMAVLEAYDRGGQREVSTLLKRAVEEARSLREEDGEEVE